MDAGCYYSPTRFVHPFPPVPTPIPTQEMAMRKSLWLLLSMCGIAVSWSAVKTTSAQMEAQEMISSDRERPSTTFRWVTKKSGGDVIISLTIPRKVRGTREELDAWREWRSRIIDEELQMHPNAGVPVPPPVVEGGR